MDFTETRKSAYVGRFTATPDLGGMIRWPLHGALLSRVCVLYPVAAGQTEKKTVSADLVNYGYFWVSSVDTVSNTTDVTQRVFLG